MIRYRYNQQTDPPAPFVYGTFQNPADSTELRDVPAQIDKVVASSGEPWVLLGRDILNAHRLFLDGPQLTLEIG